MKLKGNKNIFCSVSAGYSSIMMASKMEDWYPNHNIVYGMANTSKERIESLDFMNECDIHFGLDLCWIEPVVNQGKGVGTGFKVVNFDELKTHGELFEDGIKKYGIPSVINKWCNRDLKLVPLKKFCDSIFGLNNYSIAVGIRADEIDRVSKNYNDNNIFYPLVEHKVTTRDRNIFWDRSPVQIGIPAYKGNCDLCFEKSNRKIMTIIKEDPYTVEWWHEMSEKYSRIPIDGKPSYNQYVADGGMNFYRQNKSISDLVSMSKTPFSKATDEYVYENELFDMEGECGGGCTVF